MIDLSRSGIFVQNVSEREGRKMGVGWERLRGGGKAVEVDRWRRWWV